MHHEGIAKAGIGTLTSSQCRAQLNLRNRLCAIPIPFHVWMYSANFNSMTACEEHRVLGHTDIHGLGESQLWKHWYTYNTILFGHHFVVFIFLQFPTPLHMAFL